MNKVLFVAVLLSLGSCGSDCCSPEHAVEEQLVGKWVAFESGNSDGAGYYVTSIPVVPAQWISFWHDGTVTTNIQGFGGYYDIDIRTDTVPHPTIGGATIVRTDTILTFYKSRYTRKGESDGLRMFGWDILDGDLYLYPGCFEGCHLGLRRAQ